MSLEHSSRMSDTDSDGSDGTDPNMPDLGKESESDEADAESDSSDDSRGDAFVQVRSFDDASPARTLWTGYSPNIVADVAKFHQISIINDNK